MCLNYQWQQQEEHSDILKTNEDITKTMRLN